MKWISRIRPIQLHDGIGPSASVIMVNAYFALVSGLSLLDIDYDVRNDEWWKSYITDTTYLLHNHSVSIEALTQEMRVLQALDLERKERTS